MFASSPALSALENPIYDVGVLDCKTDTTAAPPSGSRGKVSLASRSAAVKRR